MKDMPPDLRAEVESVTTGKLVERCERCEAKTCKCATWPKNCEVCGNVYVRGEVSDEENYWGADLWRDYSYHPCRACMAVYLKQLTPCSERDMQVSFRFGPWWPLKERLAANILNCRMMWWDGKGEGEPLETRPEKRRRTE